MGCGFTNQGVEVTFGGNLTAVSGIGASAAATVSLARAVAAAQGKTLTEEQIMLLEDEIMEKYDENPSL
jgi:mevalonate kinase